MARFEGRLAKRCTKCKYVGEKEKLMSQLGIDFQLHAVPWPGTELSVSGTNQQQTSIEAMEPTGGVYTIMSQYHDQLQ